jgi:hypothetical protein
MVSEGQEYRTSCQPEEEASATESHLARAGNHQNRPSTRQVRLAWRVSSSLGIASC